jgi:hypothetical protein
MSTLCYDVFFKLEIAVNITQNEQPKDQMHKMYPTQFANHSHPPPQNSPFGTSTPRNTVSNLGNANGHHFNIVPRGSGSAVVRDDWAGFG